MSYADFLARKAEVARAPGIRVPPSDIHPFLHPWQRELVAWALSATARVMPADRTLTAAEARHASRGFTHPADTD